MGGLLSMGNYPVASHRSCPPPPPGGIAIYPACLGGSTWFAGRSPANFSHGLATALGAPDLLEASSGCGMICSQVSYYYSQQLPSHRSLAAERSPASRSCCAVVPSRTDKRELAGEGAGSREPPARAVASTGAPRLQVHGDSATRAL